MKSNLTEKLLTICGSADKTYGCNDIESITQLTEEQRIQVEAELIKHFEFDKIVWMELPSGLTEDGEKAISVKSTIISDSDNSTYKHKVGYVYNVSFTPKMYEPGEMYKPVKDGCVFSPTVYNPETFEPKQSITLTWSPEFPQDLDAPQRTYEDDKQMIRSMLEKVLDNPEEYRPKGHTGCLVRYAVV
tara:strand:- start:751 stop:1314 length:564 start_codon:yes stop_codon:yes gene_type:complete